MRRISVLIIFLLLACQAPSTLVARYSKPGTISHQALIPKYTPLPASSLTTSPTFANSVNPTSTFTLTPVPAIAAQDVFTTRYHPDGPLYVGDRVSIEVISPQGFDTGEKQVQVLVEGNPLNGIGTSNFGAYGIGGRSQATLTWAWNTGSLTAGDYVLSFTVLPDGPEWFETVHLYPATEIPFLETRARWESVETQCCVLHYITSTDADRDLSSIMKTADDAAEVAALQMGVEFEEPISVTLLPRVLGHGGFAGNEIYVSYLDRHYAGNDLAQVLHHEMIHILDGRLGGELRPSILVEGLAVYLTGGHFKKEPIYPRAAALLDLGWYIPLETLTDSFYSSQHEIGYLEGAALVEYLVNTFGWEAFVTFYRDIHPHLSGEQSDAMDAAMQVHFGLTLTQIEGRFKSELRRQQAEPAHYDDLRLSVAFYETVRRYQQALDPSAYFLTAWLPDGREMRERGIVADYLRRPGLTGNLVIENLLVNADKKLRAGDYDQTDYTLERINRQLDWHEYRLTIPMQGVLILLLTHRRPRLLPRPPALLELAEESNAAIKTTIAPKSAASTIPLIVWNHSGKEAPPCF